MVTIARLRSSKGRKWHLLVLWVALTAGIGLMGPAMAFMGDSLFIAETVNTGDIDPVFTYSDGYRIGCGWGSISTSINASDPGVLDVNIYNAPNGSEWKCDFTISNQGTVPLTVKAPQISSEQVKKWFLLWWWYEDAVIVDCSLNADTVLDPGQSVNAYIEMTMNTGQKGPFAFDIDFDCAQWNMNAWQDTLHIDGSASGWF